MKLRQQVNGLTWILLVAMATLTATFFHCARALQASPVQLDDHAVPVQPVENPRPDTLVAWASAASASHPAETSDHALKRDSPGEFGQRDAGTIAVARDRLSLLTNPQSRAERSRQLADDARMYLADLAPVLGLLPAEVNRLVETASSLVLQAEQRVLECRVDPACDLHNVEDTMNTAVELEIQRLLGPEKMARAEAYPIEGLRERLPPGITLGDDSMRTLVEGLLDERQRFMQTALQAGDRVEVDNAGPAGIPVLSAATPGSSDESAQRQASATIFTERVIQRVSVLLSGEALEIFRTSQEVALESYKRRLREQDVTNAARRAAGKPTKSFGN